MAMNIGVTGQSGFVGSHLIKAINNCDAVDKCEVFDRTKYSLFDVDSMKNFVEDKDVIFHLAGKTRAKTSDLATTNTVGTLCLSEAIKMHAKRRTRLVFASSLHVYGPKFDPRPVGEEASLHPANVYGLSKLLGEQIVTMYGHGFGIRYSIVRLSNVYGPGSPPFGNSVVSTFIYQWLRGDKVVVSGDGNQARDFIYVEDAMCALMKIMSYNDSEGIVLNICTGKPTTINDLTKMMRKLTGKAVEVQYGHSTHAADHLVGDPARALQTIGFKSKTSLEEGLTKTIVWFQREKAR